MQEFFTDYGLWLLIALLVVIGLIFLLSGRKPSGDDSIAPPAIEPAASPPAVAPPPVTPLAVAPPPVEAAPVSTPVPVAQPTPVPLEKAPVASPIPAAPATIEPAPPVAEPIPVSPAVTAMADGDDDLLRLKGVGPKLKALLTELGITTFAQIAAWTETDLAAIDARLGTFKGRPVRDQWIDQAKYLASGDIAGFEAKYGKL